MYGFDYSYEPAMEGSSFFNAVKELIRETKEKIKDFMEKVKTKLRRLMGDKDQIVEDSAEAQKIVKELGTKIESMLMTASGLIDKLYSAYEKFSDKSSKTEVKLSDTASANRTDYSRYGGMDKFKASSEGEGKDANAQAWREAKVSLGEAFAEVGKVAEECKDKLKDLQRMGKLSYEATRAGYDGLRKIFNANGKFDTEWKKVQVAADWSTGSIKESLNKVVSLYKLGVNATNAYGNRLIMGFYSDASGDRLEKEDRKAKMRSDRNRVKIHREEEDWNDISSKRKDVKDSLKDGGRYRNTANNYTDEDRAAAKKAYAGESTDYILSRLYQVAYEDAQRDIAMADEYLAAYESVPGAFEFEDDFDDFDLD